MDGCTPLNGMVPEKGEQTEVNLFVQGKLMSTFKWSGRQLPIRLPEERDWQGFPDLLKEE
jgi:hypothetical protein